MLPLDPLREWAASVNASMSRASIASRAVLRLRRAFLRYTSSMEKNSARSSLSSTQAKGAAAQQREMLSLWQEGAAASLAADVELAGLSDVTPGAGGALELLSLS